jgi:hypothetical protein
MAVLYRQHLSKVNKVVLIFDNVWSTLGKRRPHDIYGCRACPDWMRPPALLLFASPLRTA